MKQEDLAIHSCALTWELLEKYPAWTEADDDTEMIRPVTSAQPFETEFVTLTLRAVFRTPRGRELRGSVVFSSAFERVYLIEIFASGEGITFNRNLNSLIPQQLERLQDALNEWNDPIFPLVYTTDVLRDGEAFGGSFDP